MRRRKSLACVLFNKKGIEKRIIFYGTSAFFVGCTLKISTRVEEISYSS